MAKQRKRYFIVKRQTRFQRDFWLFEKLFCWNGTDCNRQEIKQGRKRKAESANERKKVTEMGKSVDEMANSYDKWTNVVIFDFSISGIVLSKERSTKEEKYTANTLAPSKISIDLNNNHLLFYITYALHECGDVLTYILLLLWVFFTICLSSFSCISLFRVGDQRLWNESDKRQHTDSLLANNETI